MTKKWYLSVVLAMLLSSLSTLIVAQSLRPAEPEIAAKAWILIDANTGRVILERNADDRLPPASLAKMMTTYLVSNEIAQQRLTEDTEVLISDNAWELGGAKTDGSTMFLSPRSKVSVIDLMHGVIIQSGNDAAIALAEQVAGGEYAFADLMNQQAELLGMTNTQYMNSTGLPAEGMYTSARDLSLMAQSIILDHPEYYKIYAKKYFQHNNINQPNRNRLLWRDKSVDGLKTGHTEEAGYCLVASATRKGMRLISVVMGAKSKAARAQESQKLLSYGFRYYETDKMYSAGDVVKKDAPVWYGTENKVNLVVSENVYLTIPQGSKKDLESKIVLNGIIEAPLTETQELGKMSVSLDKDTLAKFPIFAEHAVDEAGIFERLWDSLEIMFMGFFE